MTIPVTDEDRLNFLVHKKLRTLYAIWYKQKLNVNEEKEKLKQKYRTHNMMSLTLKDLEEEISLLNNNQ